MRRRRVGSGSLAVVMVGRAREAFLCAPDVNSEALAEGRQPPRDSLDGGPAPGITGEEAGALREGHSGEMRLTRVVPRASRGNSSYKASRMRRRRRLPLRMVRI